MTNRRTGQTFRLEDGKTVWLRNAPQTGMFFITRHGVFDLSNLATYFAKEWVISLTKSLSKAYQFRPKETLEKSILALKRALFFCRTESATNPRLRALVNKINKNCSLREEHVSINYLLEIIQERLLDLTDTSIIASSSRRTRGAFAEQLQDACDRLVDVSFLPPVRTIARPSYSPSHYDQKTVSIGELVLGESTKSNEILSIDRKAIDLIRRTMSSFLLEKYETFRSFDSRIKNDYIPIESILREAECFDRRYKTGASDDGMAPVAFPADNKDRFLLSALRLRQHLGLGSNARGFPLRINRIMRLAGGNDYLIALLEGTSECLAAAYTLVMLDSGANVQPIDDIAADYKLRKSTINGHTVELISAIKNRARYKHVEIALGRPDRLNMSRSRPSGTLSSLDAIRIWKEMSDSIRRDIENEDRNYLWVLRTAFGCGRYSPQTWSSIWGRMRRLWSDDPQLGSINFSRANIRKSMVQIAASRRNLNADLTAEVFQHSPKVSLRSYILRPHTVSRFESMIREFQNRLETIIVSTSQLATATHSEQTPWTLGNAIETGLGLTCFEPANYRSDSQYGCTSLELCSSCPMMRFVPSRESVLQLIWFQQSLVSAQPDFVRDNAERWVYVWLPALALCEAILGVLKTGPMEGFIQATTKEVLIQIESETRQRFSPW